MMEQLKDSNKRSKQNKISNSNEFSQTEVISKQNTQDKPKKIDSVAINVKSNSRSSNATKKIYSKPNSKPKAQLDDEHKSDSKIVKDKNISRKKSKSNEKLSPNAFKKPKKSKTVELNSDGQIRSKVLKIKNFDKNISKIEKVKKSSSVISISKYSEDISFDEIEKRIFEDLSNKTKKLKSGGKSLNNSSFVDCSENQKLLEKKTSTQATTSSLSEKHSNNTRLKHNEKVPKDKGVNKQNKTASSSKDKKLSKLKNNSKLKSVKNKKVDNENYESSSEEDYFEDVDDLNEFLNNARLRINKKTPKDKGVSKQNKTASSSKDKKLGKLKSTKNKKVDNEYYESSSEEDDWEDVDELSEILKSKDNKCGKDVQIELEAENILWGIKKRRRRTQQEQIEDYLRKEINRTTKEVHEYMHKTHLLCLLSHGMYVNSLLCSETLSSCALSVIPQLYYSPKRLDISHLEKFVNWFHSHFKIKSNNNQELTQNVSVEETLIRSFETKSPTNTKEMVLIFVVTCRTIGMTVRYIQNLSPMTWKPSSSALLKPKKPEDETETKPLSQESGPAKSKEDKGARNMPTHGSETEVKCKVAKQREKRKKSSSSDEEYDSEDEDDDDDFKSPVKFNKKGATTSNRKSIAKRRRSDEIPEGNKKQKKEVFQDWAEVYVEEEEKWIPVDISRNKIHCTSEIEARTSNLAYVVAFNPDQTVKDVTKRYLSSWLSHEDKVRCDSSWWSKSLKPFTRMIDRKERKENKEMEENLKMQPLPKAISEYKNHQLYALQRHLLKFEAIYPPDAAPVGFIKGEPVFSRDCVKNLWGRENWIKEAKTVKVDEVPYKIVKARPKWDRNTCQILKDRPLELFGEWQVEDYDPPTAKNGRVPRNEYGNVDLFKPCMLPKGCVYIRVNGLNRVARKLNVDCVPAVTGFDFHSGSCHAVHDGFIVCEEHKDFLIDAWHQDQMEQVKKEEEKRIKRIYDNWKKLINGITLKDRLKEKYGVSVENISSKADSSCSKAKETKRKIKQEDLDALPASTITHSVVNLKIDFEASVVNKMKMMKPKRSATRGKAKPKNKDDKLSPLNSSDSEDLSDGEKTKKIRNILNWNPSVDKDEADPGLSDDDTDEENGTTHSHLKKSSLMLTPISHSSSANSTNNKFSSRTVYIKNSKTKRKLASSERLSSGSDSEKEDVTLPAETSHTRRSRRKTIKQIKYNDDGGSPSDISVEDSDTGDATYCPVED